MIVIVTGATSGIGQETARQLVQQGHIVYSFSRRTKDEKGIHYIPCDLRSLEDMQKAVKQVIEEQGHLDCLINNAGMGISGAIESHSQEEIETIVETNLLAPIHLSRLCIPYLRETKGRILFVSSVAGDISIPFQTMYSLTKAALISFSEGLKNELRPFSIQVSCILPGDTHTSFTENRVKSNADPLYGNRVQRSVEKMEKDERKGMSAQRIAKKIAKLVKKKHPPLVCTVGISYHVLLFLKKCLPRRWVNAIVYRMYAK